jgi:hypothetical protein
VSFNALTLTRDILDLFAEAARMGKKRAVGRRVDQPSSFDLTRILAEQRALRQASAVAEQELDLRAVLRRGVRLEQVLGTPEWLERRVGRVTFQNLTTGKTQAARSPRATRRAWRQARTLAGLCWHCPRVLAPTSKTCCVGCLEKR